MSQVFGTCTFSETKPASLPLKHGAAWKRSFSFGALNGLFSGAFAVSFRKCVVIISAYQSGTWITGEKNTIYRECWVIRYTLGPAKTP